MARHIFGIKSDHFDTARAPLGWWALYVFAALAAIVFVVSYFLPALRELFFSGVFAAAAYLSGVFGI